MLLLAFLNRMVYLCTDQRPHIMQEKRLQQRNQFLNFMQRHSHLMVWLALYLVITFISSRHLGWESAIINATITTTPMVIVGAVFQYLLLPHMRQRNRMAYIAMMLFIVVLMVLLSTQMELLVIRLVSDPPANTSSNVKTQGMLLIHGKYTFLLLSTAMATTISYMIDERKRQMADFHEQQMQEQLKYLRAQINPHFLFNALNCIYALTMIQDEKAPDSVLKLSEMLRYVIDDCRSDEVLLTKEIKYIQNYIDFQRIRMEQDPNLTFEVHVADPNYKIPPMILQPIIENCFKHSRLVDDPNAWAHIQVRQNESGLLFTCDNSKPKVDNFSRQSAINGRQDEERTGIGLMNVQQRLDVLFGNKCSLKVIEDDTHYKTILHI